MKTHTTALLAASLSTVCVALPASAQDMKTSVSPLGGIYACAEIADSVERLSCYDSTVADVRAREQKREIVAIDADIVQDIKKESFGFNLPSLPKVDLPSLGDGGEAIQGQDEVELAVSRVSKSGRDYVVTMENGQVWRQVGGRVNYIPRGDLTARVTSAAMGSYKMSLSNGKDRVRGLRVRRIK